MNSNKLEYVKHNNRKYSPEVDLNIAIKESLKKQGQPLAKYQ
jgi:hypothetical protein